MYVRLHFVIAAQIVQVAQSIWINLVDLVM